MRLLIFFLSAVLAFASCNSNSAYYVKDMSGIDSADYAQKLLQGMLRSYYQGTAPAEAVLYEAISFDTTNAAIWREFGVPYLKRGFYNKSFYYYEKAIKYDPTNWQGWRGYNYLYFYRDFERAIADFNALDSLTEGFTDYPQGQSVDYMRGIAYYGLGNYKLSMQYLQMYVDDAIKNNDESWVDPKAFLYYGLAYLALEDYKNAAIYFDKVIKYDVSIADGYYYKAIVMLNVDKIDEAKTLILKAEKCFNQGAYHYRPYIEVLGQIYKEDIEDLKDTLYE